MKPSEELKLVVQLADSMPSFEGGIKLEDLNLHFRELAHDDLNFTQSEIKDLGFEMSDLLATYGNDTVVNKIISGEVKEQELWAALKDGGYCKVVHAINYDDKDFTNKSFIIGMLFGNFSREYLVYADNEQDAMDCLADYEVERKKANPERAIFMVDTYGASAKEMEEIQEREDAGELMRLGNDGNLFDISDLIIKSATGFSIDAGMDISEHLKLKRQFEQPSLSI